MVKIKEPVLSGLQGQDAKKKRIRQERYQVGKGGWIIGMREKQKVENEGKNQANERSEVSIADMACPLRALRLNLNLHQSETFWRMGKGKDG